MAIDRSNPTQTPAARNAVNKYNFLGKETQVETGYIDLQARFYDPTIGRFFSIDPETEGQLEFSPYHYSFNNPIRFSDPDGRWPWDGLVARFKQWYNTPLTKDQQQISRAASISNSPAKTQGENLENSLILGLSHAVSGTSIGSFRRPANMYKPRSRASSISESPTVPSKSGTKQNSADTHQRGATRSAMYSSEWPSASLQETVAKFAPGSEGVVTGQKTLYQNSESGIQVVSDNSGNYFRIQDTNLSGKRQYLDMNGNIPNNKFIDGKQSGRNQAEYNQVTHFNNTDEQ